MLRLFTCIQIPDNLRKTIINFQEDLMKVPIKAKFIEPENLHITIVFLGNVDENKLSLLKRNLDDSVKGVKKFHVKLEGLKLIPNENFIRVIGIDVKDEEENISKLIRMVGKSLGGKYHESTKLTLCRVKKILNKELLREFIEKNRDIEIGMIHVENVSLIKSKLTKKGPIYETLHKSVFR